MSPEAIEFAAVVVAALLILDVVYEVTKMWFDKRKGGD